MVGDSSLNLGGDGEPISNSSLDDVAECDLERDLD